ncbi:MAG: BACON domain-containing protein, partial [Acidobacteriota bacterium]
AVFPSAGGTGVLRIQASAAACPWNLTVEASWLTFAGASQSVGDAEVAFAVEPNPGRDGREGAVWVAGERVRIVQDGVGYRLRRRVR